MGNESAIIAERRGMPVYLANPSVPGKDEVTRTRKRQMGNERKGLVINDGGEILGNGTAVAFEWEEVDKERFVKLYLGGVKQASGLSKAGMTMFEMVYNQLRESHGSDEVKMPFLTSGKSRNVYYPGIKELLEKGFLYHSPIDGVFFVNIRYMFNGDRLAFIKAYHLKGAGPTAQLALPMMDQAGREA